MSMTLKCPYLSPSKIITLKNPELNDEMVITQKLKMDKAQDGTIYTYTKQQLNQKFNWHFIDLTLMQAQELYDFILFCQGKDIDLTDFNATPFKVRCLTVTPVFIVSGRGKGKTTVKEAVSTELQFELVP
jgi:hypothetical protein